MQTRVTSIFTVLVLVLCAWLLLFTFIGFGHVVIHAPEGAVVLINGKQVSPNTRIKLRPGTYTVATLSARNYSKYDLVTAPLLRTKDYTPELTERSVTSIADASVGVSSLVGMSVQAFNPQWFGDRWVVMEYGESTPDVLVAHYDNNRWQKAYRTGEALDTTQIPAPVLQLVNSKEEAAHANAN